MKTRVFRIDLSAETVIDQAIVNACETQLQDGFKLASSVIWGVDLILIFQKL
jgi:hypothetical protein